MVGFPLLCLSHWKIQHFDGIYKERGGGLYMAIGYVSLPESKLTNDVSQLLSSDPCEPCWLVGFLRSSTKSLKAHMSPEKKKKHVPPKKKGPLQKKCFSSSNHWKSQGLCEFFGGISLGKYVVQEHMFQRGCLEALHRLNIGSSMRDVAVSSSSYLQVMTSLCQYFWVCWYLIRSMYCKLRLNVPSIKETWVNVPWILWVWGCLKPFF